MFRYNKEIILAAVSKALSLINPYKTTEPSSSRILCLRAGASVCESSDLGHECGELIRV